MLLRPKSSGLLLLYAPGPGVDLRCLCYKSTVSRKTKVYLTMRYSQHKKQKNSKDTDKDDKSDLGWSEVKSGDFAEL